MSTLKVKYNDEWQEVGSTGTALTALAENVGILNSKVDEIHVSNPNLLDNPFFSVNQRGVTSGLTYAYIHDRWMFDYEGSSSWSYADGVLTIARDGRLLQKLESALYDDLVGKTITISVMMADGSIKSGSCPVARGELAICINDSTLKAFISENGYFRILNMTSGNIGVRAVKLELGSHSTLAYDSAPDYATELLKCQRYYWNTKAVYATNDTGICVGYIDSFTKYQCIVFAPVTMASIPSINIVGTAKLNGAKDNFTLDGLSLVSSGSNSRCLWLAGSFNAGSLVQNTPYTLWTSDSSYIEFIADL